MNVEAKLLEFEFRIESDTSKFYLRIDFELLTIQFEDGFRVSGQRGPGEYDDLSFFQDLVLFFIWHTTLPTFVGPYPKVLLQIGHFYSEYCRLSLRFSLISTSVSSVTG